MSTDSIRQLFDRPIDRRIEEVIKVDQTDDDILSSEVEEYVTTRAIRDYYTRIYDEYGKTDPHDGIAIWVSGFFGSGKSSFAKMLGLSVANRKVGGESIATTFGVGTGDKKIQVLLEKITTKIPTHSVIFDVSTDRGIRSGNQTLTEIMYGLFLQSLGYAKDLDLSELEVGLEEKDELARFEDEYRLLFKKEWSVEKGKVAFALSEASRVLHSLDPATYPMADSWVKAVRGKTDITPNKLGERANELMRRRRPGQRLIFVVDEVGQFVARDVQKMLDLQGVVKALAMSGRGKHWVVVTSQEKLGELVSGLDDKKIEHARLMDRFPLQVHLEASDISEVTSRRVLSKNSAAQKSLAKLFEEYQPRLREHTKLTAEIKLPELTRDGFIELYPLLPYQIDLIIQVVSGLRTQGGASKHVGGANRTIIKLAQQLLINPAVNLAGAPLGALVRLDQVYDLVQGNIGSEIREKIAALGKELSHPLAQPVAKVICLLQYVKSVHRTAANIAAALHPGVAADSQLALVKEALAELEKAHKVRLGDDGYRIPSPAEDDWETTRSKLSPTPGDSNRAYAEVLAGFWQSQPTHMLFETKTFKAGLVIHGRVIVDGDMMFHFQLVEDGKEFQARAAELRTRSQQERKDVFWVIALNDALDREVVELFRSKEMLARKERETKGEDTPGLIAEERVRQRRHHDELRRLMKASCLAGHVYFRGNDRSPGDGAIDVGKSAGEILGHVLPEVFERFKEAAAKSAEVRKGFDALFSAENLQGLPSVFSSLELLRDEKGKAVFRLESGPLKEVFDRLAARAQYGENASGRWLSEEFAKEPFGWDFDVVRLLVLALLRAGKVEATSKAQTIDAVTSLEARKTFVDNNLFRQASFRPRTGGCDFGTVVQGAEHCKDVFGVEVKEIEESVVAARLRELIGPEEIRIQDALVLLRANHLPGADMLQTASDVLRSIKTRRDCPAIQEFSASHRALKDAMRRAAELEQSLTEPRLYDLGRARKVMTTAWPFLLQEADVSEQLRAKAANLQDLLARESFYKELPAIEQNTKALEVEYDKRFEEALSARITAYSKAFDQLVAAAGWGDIDEGEQRRLAIPFVRGKTRETERLPIAQLRSERDACDGRLRAAITELRRIIDGERVVSVSLGSYFGGGVETEEQLDAALLGVREECASLIGAGKKVIVQ